MARSHETLPLLTNRYFVVVTVWPLPLLAMAQVTYEA
jgi:hypothetical protein